MPTGAPGTWRSPRSARTTRPRRRSSRRAGRARERSAYDVAARAFERAAVLALDDERRGRLLYAGGGRGLAGRARRPRRWRCSTKRAASPRPSTLRLELEHLRGHIAAAPRAARRGAERPAGRRRAGRARRSPPCCSPRPSSEPSTPATSAGARACGERARALAALRPDARTAFFALLTDGIAGVLTGDGEGGAPSIRGRARGAQAHGRAAERPPPARPGPRSARSGSARPTSTGGRRARI